MTNKMVIDELKTAYRVQYKVHQAWCEESTWSYFENHEDAVEFKTAIMNNHAYYRNYPNQKPVIDEVCLIRIGSKYYCIGQSVTLQSPPVKNE